MPSITRACMTARSSGVKARVISRSLSGLNGS